MAKIIVPSHIEHEERRVLEFRYIDDPEAGFSFPIEHGEVVFKSEEGKRNYEWCLNHPEKVINLGERVERWSGMVAALAECECGKIIRLEDRYYGCSQCSYCGRWHALGGYEVKPPEEWEEDLEEDEW